MSHFPSDSYRLGAANRDPEEEALGWVVRLTSGDVTEGDRREFADWNADPENAAAYVRAERLWIGIGPILQEQEASGWPNAPVSGPVHPAPVQPVPIQPVPIHVAQPAEAPVSRWRMGRLPRRAAIAASIVLVGLASAQYWNDWQYDHVSASRVAEGTVLADGSHVTMGPGTAFSTDFENGARHVSLARGEAYFDVRHDPAHPFVVSSGNGLVRVLGTAFTVRKEDDGSVTVTVTRGRVQVTSGASHAILTPDRQIAFSDRGLGRIHAVDASLATAWTRGRLIMENKPLAEVLRELDRYKGGKILLLNGEASERRINAVIDLGHIDSWLTALASSQGLRLTRAGPLTILR